MNQNKKLSFAEFSRKLLKYTANGIECATQEKEIVSCFERIITQRDECLTRLMKDKETYSLWSEDIEDLNHQREEVLEMLETVEKKCNLLKLEQAPFDAKPLTNETVSENSSSSTEANASTAEETDEQFLKKMLRKYCNLYLQFDDESNELRVLSLSDNLYYEFPLNETANAESREQIWSTLGASSLHLDTWENLL
ncbi:uncharacterized protein LOC128721261 [Anopheles nili]|uniref:uncharacterized protein LOC128721261 n=1 Tax=Anopheles nili TaxID=185578 RepID=UPI00237BC1D8|nr:uncharacterized protein LOC128721261 [Anopheles nili]